MSIDDVHTTIDHLDDRERVRCRALMMQRLRTRARALGLDPEIVTQLTTPMVDAFIDLQHRVSLATLPASGRRVSYRASRPCRTDLR